MKNLLLTLIILSIGTTSIAYSVNEINEKNIKFDNSQSTTLNSSNLEKLAEIELNLFGKNFSSKKLEDRLARVEKKIFSSTYTDLTNIQRLDNIISNYNKYINTPNIAIRTLTKLEKKILGQEFPINTTEDRIERLEQKVFGAVQSGNLNSRLKSIEIASKNINNNEDNSKFFDYNNDDFNTGGSKWNFIGGGSIQGYPTGLTPPLTPCYNSDLNNFARPYYNKALYGPHNFYNRWSHRPMFTPPYSTYSQRPVNIFGTGSRNFGTGSRVTILN